VARARESPSAVCSSPTLQALLRKRRALITVGDECSGHGVQCANAGTPYRRRY
jgi:hypothetical protein